MPKTAAIVAAILIAAGFQTISIQDAQACSPGPTHSTEIVADDSPECLQFIANQYDSAVMRIINDCDEDAEFLALECGECESEMIAESGAQVLLRLERRYSDDVEDDEPIQQVYAWTMGDEEGLLETEVTIFNTDIEGAGCPDHNRVYFCSSPNSPAPSGSMALVLLMLSILFIRNRAVVAAPSR